MDHPRGGTLAGLAGCVAAAIAVLVVECVVGVAVAGSGRREKCWGGCVDVVEVTGGNAKLYMALARGE